MIGFMNTWIFGLVILSFQSCSEKTSNYSFEGSANKVKASYNCKRKGPGWNLPDGDVNKPELINLMKQHDINTIWSQITRAKLPKWLWINGSEYRPTPGLNVLSKENHGCAIVTQEKKMTSYNCSDPTVGFICDINGFRCPSPNKEDVCSNIKGRNLLTGCGKSNWFSAREKCKHNKGDLAILDSKREIGASMKTLAEQNLFTYCDKFYIGLFQENWVIINKDGGKNIGKDHEVVEEHFWNIDEPSSARMDCVGLVLKEESLVWESWPCYKKITYICEFSGHPEIASSTSAVSEDDTSKMVLGYSVNASHVKESSVSGSSFPTWISVLVAAIAIIIINNAIWIGCCLKMKGADTCKRRNRTTRNRTPRTIEQGQAETSFLN